MNLKKPTRRQLLNSSGYIGPMCSEEFQKWLNKKATIDTFVLNKFQPKKEKDECNQRN